MPTLLHFNMSFLKVESVYFNPLERAKMVPGKAEFAKFVEKQKEKQLNLKVNAFG